MKVVSLFDGMSCGQIALKELDINVSKYYASEIDKFAIKQTQHNFPNTIQLGDVTTVKDLGRIDLVIGGSPCQGFSFAGKGLNFDDPRSKLFFEFVRILEECRRINPEVKFLLENVNMKRKHLGVISKMLGVFPVRINSELVSAQKRDRFYWTNIKTKRDGLFNELFSDIPQPKDRGIFLKDILEKEVPEKYYLKNWPNEFKGMAINGKGNTLRTSGHGTPTTKHNFDIIGVVKNDKGLRSIEKSMCIDANYYKGLDCHQQRTGVLHIPEATKNQVLRLDNKERQQQKRIYDPDGKMVALTSGLNGRFNVYNDYGLRRLTPTECARLQTVPDWYEFMYKELQYFGYICSVSKTTKIWLRNVALKDVIGKYQTDQLDFVTCTTLDLLEQERLSVERLTKRKSAKLRGAIEMCKQKNTETFVSCITKDLQDTEAQNCQLNKNKRLVNIVIEKLETEELWECAHRIIEVTNCMEIHLVLKKEGKKGRGQQAVVDICLVKTEENNTKSLWRVRLGGNLKKEKLFTISTLINWIIEMKIYTYAKDVLNIQFYIENLSYVQRNYLSLDISDLRMESILSTSDSQIYKMLGNGWTVEVIKHIFSFLK